MLLFFKQLPASAESLCLSRIAVVCKRENETQVQLSNEQASSLHDVGSADYTVVSAVRGHAEERLLLLLLLVGSDGDGIGRDDRVFAGAG